MEESERVWILDTELNGAHPGEIIELAAVEMVDLVITGRYRQWRFKPKEPVNYHATRVHGITNRDLARCPSIHEHVDEIRTMLGDLPIAGHAVHVELAALQRVLHGWKPTKAYDTLRMVRRAYPDLERHRLSSVGDHLGLSEIAGRLTKAKAHSAFYDALLCGLIMRHVVEDMDEPGRHEMLTHAEIMAHRRAKEIQAGLRAEKARLKRMRRMMLP